MNFSVTQLVKASLLALVLATPVAFSTPEVQAIPVTPHKKVALATKATKYRQAKKVHHYKKRVRHHKKVAYRKMQMTK